ncbi:MAG: cellulase family glycosylhydrolase [Ilumatobacteraceae bacterium]|nr:cellulase family glycosylhydrolase [Ilumatobacteraceae bacterium]
MSAADRFAGFVTVRDGRVVDASGTPLLLRGMGLGNWLLAEGYMWRLSPGRESAREIEALVVELVGSERAERFWTDFRDRFISADDIDRIAAEGMDHVRLPINWRVVMDPDGAILDDGMALIDRLIGWCRDAGLWVLLDLHGAPGGQTGTNIDDSNGQPELFMDERNVELTERLWVELATRYRDETAVLGYDLLNEPLPNEWQHRYAAELAALYRRLSAAIRRVDTQHLIMYEGSHWATNWSIFDEVWDPNSVLQFHKYWSPPDRPTIQQFIDVGERLGLPIYMGEGGENNTSWLATAFQLYEDHGIGWNFWPWKKIDTLTSPCSIDAPSGWAEIVAYANGAGPQPPSEDAWATLCDLVAASHIDRCTYRPEIVRALFRRVPISLPATAFGFAGPGRSHDTSDATPLSGFRSDDAVTITLGDLDELPAFEHTDGTPDPDLTVVLAEGDWVAYDIESVDTAALDIDVWPADGSTIDGTAPLVVVDGVGLDVTASDGCWVARSPGPVRSGRHVVRVEGPAGGVAFRRLDVRDRADSTTSERLGHGALDEAVGSDVA